MLRTKEKIVYICKLEIFEMVVVDKTVSNRVCD